MHEAHMHIKAKCDITIMPKRTTRNPTIQSRKNKPKLEPLKDVPGKVELQGKKR